jgi:hypothetical protein
VAVVFAVDGLMALSRLVIESRSPINMFLASFRLSFFFFFSSRVVSDA